jgi:hypothetical protein
MVAVAALIPQLPTITVVTPDSAWQIAGIRMTLISSWVCTSINPAPARAPGHQSPAPPHVQRRGDSHNSIALHRHVAAYCGPPLPSITVTFLKSQSTFIAITPFRHADKLTIYKAEKQWKTTQKPDHFVILLFTNE